jgi:hypothetical protein
MASGHGRMHDVKKQYKVGRSRFGRRYRSLGLEDSYGVVMADEGSRSARRRVQREEACRGQVGEEACRYSTVLYISPRCSEKQGMS